MEKGEKTSVGATLAPELGASAEDQRVQDYGDKLLQPLNMLAKTMSDYLVAIDCVGDQRELLNTVLDGILRNVNLNAQAKNETIRTCLELYLGRHPNYQKDTVGQERILKLLDLLCTRRNIVVMDEMTHVVTPEAGGLDRRGVLKEKDMREIYAEKASAAPGEAGRESNITEALGLDATIAIFAGPNDPRTQAIHAGIAKARARGNGTNRRSRQLLITLPKNNYSSNRGRKSRSSRCPF